MTPVIPAAAMPTSQAMHELSPPAATSPAAVSAAAPAIAICMAAYALIVGPRMVLGLCGGDAGELQTAVATLGITHPPGYSTYVLIGWLLTRIPLLEPAAMLTILNAACGAVAIGLLAWLTARGGATTIAITLALAWLLSRRAVLGAVAMPEVYAPSLMLLLIAIVCVWRAAASRRWQPLIWAALAYGLLIANRPPALVLAPGLAAMLLLTPACTGLRSGMLRKVSIVALIAAAPSVVTVGYVLLRDRPDIPYNYMAINADNPWTFEPGWYGHASRWDRLTWLLTARQYHRAVAPSVADASGQARSLADQLGRPYWTSFVGGLTLASVGLLAVFRRSGRAGVIVVTLLAGNLAFYLLYRQAGLPAMLLPLLAVFAGLMAMGITTVCAGLRLGLAGEVAAVCVFATLAWWHADADFLPRDLDDGTEQYLAALDLGALPDGARVLVDIEGPSHALAYQLAVRENRRDVRIRMMMAKDWAAAVAANPQHSWIYTLEAPAPTGYELAPIGGLWEARPQSREIGLAVTAPGGVPERTR